MGGWFPQGIEVLIKKASVDPAFARQLLADRAEAARQIELDLAPSEVAMLDAVPDEQLESIIAKTTVPGEHRRTFLGKAAAAMVAVVATSEAEAAIPAPTGVRPDRPEPAPEPTTRALVIGIMAPALGVTKEQLTDAARWTDLKADGVARERLRVALVKHFSLAFDAERFMQLPTVGSVVAEVDTGIQIRTRVLAILKSMVAPELKKVTAQSRLAEDLGIDPAKLAELRKRLTVEYRAYLDWNEFKKLQTAGDLVEAVREALIKKQAAEATKPSAPVSRGIRPDPPVSSFGLRITR